MLARKKIGSKGTAVKSYAAEKASKQLEEFRKAEKDYSLDLSTESARKLYDRLLNDGGVEKSRSGHIYAKGRKPASYQYEFLDEFFRKGEQRLSPDESLAKSKDYKADDRASLSDGIPEKVKGVPYHVETWNGKEWVAEDYKNAKGDTDNVGEIEQGSSEKSSNQSEWWKNRFGDEGGNRANEKINGITKGWEQKSLSDITQGSIKSDESINVINATKINGSEELKQIVRDASSIGIDVNLFSGDLTMANAFNYGDSIYLPTDVSADRAKALAGHELHEVLERKYPEFPEW